MKFSLLYQFLLVFLCLRNNRRLRQVVNFVAIPHCEQTCGSNGKKNYSLLTRELLWQTIWQRQSIYTKKKEAEALMHEYLLGYKSRSLRLGEAERHRISFLSL